MRLGPGLSMRAASRGAVPGGRGSALRIFTWRPVRLLANGSARQVMLLLLLAAALAGLFLLLEFVASLTSTGPRELLAVTSSPEGTLGVPNGVGLLEFLILAVSIVLASGALLVPLGWPLRRASLRRSWSLALGVLAAASLVSAGAYLAFSGILGGSISYDEHMVRRADLEAGSLILLAAFFLSVTIAGLLNWRLLVASLVVWLVAAGAFGFLDSKSVDGLLLFPRTETQGLPGDFGVAVRGIQQGDAAAIAQPADSDQLLLSEVTALRDVPPTDSPVFRVTGAAHTRYLRTSTGDSYRDGAWSQLERAVVRLERNKRVPDALGPLAEQLHLPAAAPLHEFTDRIVVTPVEGADALPAGVLPAPANLRSVDTPATYFPFSETLASDSDLSRYELESTVPLFALSQKVNAASVADPVYLQLPEALPPRVHELAEQVVGEASSPYLRARRLQVYLQEQYAFGPAGSAREARPPVGQDPVDWFLFDRRVGTSGNFSSAFVVLARAVGVPARAVSGWVVATQEDTQTVYQRQAHQWAEIALDGLGWVTVDPFPRDAFSDTDIDHPWATALEELATSARPEVRGAVPALWGDSDNPEALLQLFEAIDSVSDPTARHAAQATLSALVLDRFTEMLLNHEDPEFRGAVAYGLEVLADPEALGALVEALAADEDAGVRVSVADALAVVGKDAAEEALLRALAADEDAAVRAASARALGALKTDWTASRMLFALGSDPSPEVRAAIAWALGEIRDNATLLPLLAARTGDASAEVRAAAAGALTQWEFAALLEILESTAEPALRAAAAQLMGEGRFAEAIAPLGAALSDPVEQVREAARRALQEIGEVTWLESGGGVLFYQGDLAFLPFVTAESHEIAPPDPIFRVRGSSHTSLLRVAVGDIYRDGEWFPAEQEALPAGVAGIGFRPHDIRPLQAADAGNLDTIQLSGIWSAEVILAGPAPTSLHAQAFLVPVSYRVPSHTVVGRGPARYGWDAIVYDYSPEQLHAAETWAVTDGFEYMQLPEAAWVERARALATTITAGETTPYGKAKAIEQYLIEEYTYQPAGPSLGTAPPGRDPIETFLFDSREGTCGALSSAFVILARTVGIPARVVSGWAVAEKSSSQIVFGDQSHQWAEVPFEGLGWVTFDPAPDGAPARSLRMSSRPMNDWALTSPGWKPARHWWSWMARPSWSRGRQPARPKPRLASRSTRWWAPLTRATCGRPWGICTRTASGDSWTPEMSRTRPEAMFPVRHESSSTPWRTAAGWRPRRCSGLAESPRGSPLTGSRCFPRKDPRRCRTEPCPRRVGCSGRTSTESSTPSAARSPRRSRQRTTPGPPTSPSSPVSNTMPRQPSPMPPPIHNCLMTSLTTSGNWPSRSPAVTTLPLPGLSRWSDTSGPTMNTRFADSTQEGAPPAGRDPVDWFLFDSRRGTSGQFSSAFAVLARSVGIPTRVVSGFVISPTAEQQAVHADQAHQWAEVALEGLGWVRFDPTASGGAPSRVPGAPPIARVVESGDAAGEDTSSPADTITDITDAPAETRRLTPFVVAGTVVTSDGRDVTG